MRKLLLTTAAVAAAIGLAGCGKKEPVPETPNTLTDSRDGQTYKTVEIGTQTWMAQNLNYQTDSSWCYKNKGSNCRKYGRLYEWNAAKKACPAGYHLPSREEWDVLAQAVGGVIDPYNKSWSGAGNKLKTNSGWKKPGIGTDDYGFSALPSGYLGPENYFNDIHQCAPWWTATGYSDRSAYFRIVAYNTYDLSEDIIDMYFGLSVRCVADRP